MVKSAKKIIAILVLLILFGTLFPFRLKSFLQWIWAALPLIFLSVLWLTDSEKRGKFLRFVEALCLVYSVLIFALFGFMKWYSARDLTEAPDYILIFGGDAGGRSLPYAREKMRQRIRVEFEISGNCCDRFGMAGPWRRFQ